MHTDAHACANIYRITAQQILIAKLIGNIHNPTIISKCDAGTLTLSYMIVSKGLGHWLDVIHYLSPS